MLLLFLFELLNEANYFFLYPSIKIRFFEILRRSYLIRLGGLQLFQCLFYFELELGLLRGKWNFNLVDVDWVGNGVGSHADFFCF